MATPRRGSGPPKVVCRNSSACFCSADGEMRFDSFPSAAARDHVVHAFGAIEGGHQTLERLAAYLPTLER